MTNNRPNHSPPSHFSLSEVHSSVVTSGKRSIFYRIMAFAGPAYLVSVGYMDPGNWATDLAGGAHFGYSLIWVLLMSNLMAVLLQTLSARLGVVTGRDLAQACRDHYSRGVGVALWLLTEVAIAATDLAELLGTTIGLNLVFGLPMTVGVAITACDTLLLLLLGRLGIRKVEAFIVSLIAIIGMCFVYELFLAEPDLAAVAGGFVPRLKNTEALYLAIAMLGATVMPHNLYLHSALVQTRQFGIDDPGKKLACRYNLIDSIVALNGAFFVNAAILVVAAAGFYPGHPINEIQQAAGLLSDVLGSRWASIAFGLGLICSGQSSTLTGTLAGQVVMEGFIRLRVRPWVRRLITRLVAVVPAAVVVAISGSRGSYQLMILSQAILSLQLPFAIVPLLHFTSSRKAMGAFATPLWAKLLAWAVAAIIIGLNAALVVGLLREWMAVPALAPYIKVFLVPAVGGMGVFLLWLTFAPAIARWRVRPAPAALAVDGERALGLDTPVYRRIAVALDNGPADRAILRHALALARAQHSTVLLIHVVESPTTDVYGAMAADTEARRDVGYLDALADSVGKLGLQVETHIGHGRPADAIIDILSRHDADLLVMGGHGHRSLMDVMLGQTISTVRHGLTIPVLTVR